MEVSDAQIKQGGNASLTCIVSGISQAPFSLYWTKDGKNLTISKNEVYAYPESYFPY